VLGRYNDVEQYFQHQLHRAGVLFSDILYHSIFSCVRRKTSCAPASTL
jgi:hypothetical protein